MCRDAFPEAPVLPAVLGGFSDSHFLRDLGITAYGFSPVVVPFEDEQTIHGNNERIPVASVRQGRVDDGGDRQARRGPLRALTRQRRELYGVRRRAP